MYCVDNQFAMNFFHKWGWNTLGNRISTQLCSECTQIASFNRSISASELRTLANNCPLCKLLLDVIPRYHSDNQQVHIVRDGSALKIAEGPRILRLCTDLGSPLPSFRNIAV
jgi:hypothetical protein